MLMEITNFFRFMYALLNLTTSIRIMNQPRGFRSSILLKLFLGSEADKRTYNRQSYVNRHLIYTFTCFNIRYVISHILLGCHLLKNYPLNYN